MGNLAQRTLVALVAIPPALGLVFWREPLPFQAAGVLVLGLGLWEYLRMCEKGGFRIEKPMALAAFLSFLIPMLGGRTVPALVFPLFIMGSGFLFSRSGPRQKLESAALGLFGAFYFGILGSFLFRLKAAPDGAWWLLLALVLTWAYDVGAYAAGKLWGRHKMAPSLSPGKSWEGVAGGMLFNLAAAAILWGSCAAYPGTLGMGWMLGAGVLLAVTGQVGDLVESVIKRGLNAKDSGTLVPGHGGVFDRIDSLLFNAPALYLYLDLAGVL